MTVVADYATLYENEYRRRHRNLRYIWVLTVWAGLYLVDRRLALEVWRDRA